MPDNTNDAKPDSSREEAGAPRQVTVYEYVGGTEFFERLVAHFYEGVERDPVLRPLYPEDDMDGARERLTEFLVQYWGGPADYSARRGHPRLRARHLPFRIDRAARDAWFARMCEAVKASGADDIVTPVLLDYFSRAADAMINTVDEM